MTVHVKIPTPLRRITNDASTVEVEAGDIKSLLSSLEKQHPGIADRLCDENGEIRPFVNVFVNGEDIRYISGLNSPTNDGDEVSIVPAVAGGL